MGRAASMMGCRRWPRRATALVGAALVATGCGGSPSTLDPAGPGAARAATLSWWLMAIGVAVSLLVAVAVVVALARSKGRDRRAPDGRGRDPLTPVVLGGVVLPAVVLPVAYLLSLAALDALPEAGPDDLQVEVVGNQWWWEVRYPDLGIITANEIHIPVGREVRVELSSDDVQHSFWVPQLAGKIDLYPGDVNEVTLLADEPGEYLGECAEYCGIQHAKMQFLVIAEPAAEFERWAERLAEPVPEPPTALAAAGLTAFLDTGCGACHAIQGSPADGQLGPDLTHVASRRTLAAGAIPNTRGHRGGWIVNAQTIKPGALMPPMSLTPTELEAINLYLETLD